MTQDERRLVDGAMDAIRELPGGIDPANVNEDDLSPDDAVFHYTSLAARWLIEDLNSDATRRSEMARILHEIKAQATSMKAGADSIVIDQGGTFFGIYARATSARLAPMIGMINELIETEKSKGKA